MKLSEILRNIRPGEQWYLVGDDYAGLTWLDSTTKPTEAEIESARSDLLRLKRNKEVKAEAQRRIEIIVPQSLQLRALAKAIALIKKLADGAISPGEAEELQALQDLDSQQLQPIRDASGLIEQEIATLPNEAVNNYDVITNPLWP